LWKAATCGGPQDFYPHAILLTALPARRS
jgi:hypothetical protein